MQNNQQWLSTIDPAVGNYIAGFTDGEGSFNVSLRKRDDHTLGWQVKLSFNISQKDRVILFWIKHVFGCGTLRERPDGVVYFEVTNLNSLIDKVIPFFERFNFRSSYKKINFSIFTKIVNVIKLHGVNSISLQEIINLREELNKGRGRKRKHTKDNVEIRKSSETIR